MVSGSQSSRCSQTGGAELTSASSARRDHDRADDQDDERDRAVAAVLGGQIDAAGRAAPAHREEALEQRALAAGRAAAAQARREGGGQRRAAGPAQCPASAMWPPHQ